MLWYFGFFIVSGFCSLVYEVIWLRLAMAEFGVTAPLASIVLSVFMAGLALGSWGMGHLVRRVERSVAFAPLRLYALTELFIAVSGVTVPYQLAWGRRLLAAAGGDVAWGSSGYYVLSGVWIALTLLPFCTCMGATFPLAMSAIRKRFGAGARHSFSYLYLANVLGATAGAVISAFVLVELLGFQGTVLVTAALNWMLATSAFAVSLAPTLAAVPTARTSTAGFSQSRSDPARHVPALLFTTGLISMAMELVWIRQFTPFMGTVVYTFAIILALYLGATFLGSWIYRGWIRSHEPGDGGFAWIALGLLGLLPLITTDARLPLQPGLAHGALRVAISVIPFSGTVGFLTPMLVDRWSRGEPKRAGTAYAVNVLGCIIGPLLAAFLLLPFMGDRRALITLTLPLFAIGVRVALRSDPVTAGPHRVRISRALAAATILLSLLVAQVTKGYEEIFPRREVRRDYTATVVATGQGMHKHLLINGYGTTSLTPITKMMAHLPLAFLATPPQNALVVGFGMGTAFRSALSWEIPTTAVELVPSVPALFGYYHPDGPQLLKSPLAQIVIDDGRRFLERSPARYDVITVDPPPPVEAAGSSLLYSQEFYSIAKKRLRPEGILQQWVPPAEPAILASVARALGDSFPYVRVFQSVERWGLHFLASMKPIPITPGWVLAERLPPAAIADLLEWGPASTAEQQFDTVLARELPLALLIAAAPYVLPVRDDWPVNEYFFLRRTFPLFEATRTADGFLTTARR